MESEGLAYEKTEEGYVVTGRGDCGDEKIVIPETHLGLPVTGVGDFAFSHEKGLREVTIPDGLKFVGDEAFCGCDGLEILRIPAGLEKVGAYPVPRTGKNFAVEITKEVLSSYEARADSGDGEGALSVCREKARTRKGLSFRGNAFSAASAGKKTKTGL